jgi:hypothetical protein
VKNCEWVNQQILIDLESVAGSATNGEDASEPFCSVSVKRNTLLFAAMFAGLLCGGAWTFAGQPAQYEIETTLTGRLIILRDRSGDFFGLRLETPLDFAASSDPDLADMDVEQRNIKEVQLAGYTADFVPVLKALQSTLATLRGSFFGRHTIHHIRPVLFALNGDTISDERGFSVSIVEGVASDFERALASYGNSVTYQKKAKNWYVISGANSDQEYYLKVIDRGLQNPRLSLLIQYPHSLSGQYDAIVTAISKSFVP